MSAKHIVGPWEVVVDPRKKGGDRTFVTAETPEGRVIVCQTGFGHSPQVTRDTARLIAAAPEMAEALLMAETWLEGWASAESELAIIRNALSKAGVLPHDE